MIALWMSVAAASPCALTLDGTPTDRLDCSEPGAWHLVCTLPAGTKGKLRARLSLPARQIEAEARIPLSAASQGQLDLRVMGPSARAGVFVVDRAGSGMLPGQTLGPLQFCPVVQPGVEPGSPPAELDLSIAVSAHTATGFAEEVLDGGVVQRVPMYDEGTLISTAKAIVVQRPVLAAPGLVQTFELPQAEAISGSLDLKADEGWASFTWSGSRQDVPVDSGDVSLFVLDFPSADVAKAAGPGGAAGWLEDDLVVWMGGDPSSWLGLAAWRRSGLSVSALRGGPTFRGDPGNRVASAPGVDVRVIDEGRVVQVVIAHRSTPFDDAARRAIRNALSDG